jgi:hypothetical protein
MYLIIFTFIVFVPTYVNKGLYGFGVLQTQEFVILILGSVAFTIFLFMEKKMKKNLAEKGHIQGEAIRMARDLKDSYSYTGEINRKLDILQDIALGYPDNLKQLERDEDELYAPIMDAIRLFGKSNEFALRFVSLPRLELLREIKSNPENSLEFSLKEIKPEVNYFESNEFIVIKYPKSIDNIFSYIVIKKITPSQKIEDVEIMKTLTAQALFTFMFMQHRKQMHCVL